ncbi:hypothetical protein FERRO_16260 [Ferrovum sp. JA12]|uniref:LapA family protein n=1 Tax=Ferrovum sp. JA12 TaxID=1356299 RepID=UPI000713BB26|nr:LapA family protein [Ferrovum sp. JA12]KRH78634.1 hypothetical protein FERRO_16260 [Ferrovum sp. JA12]
MFYIKWIVRIVVFILLLGFAVKNVEPVTLKYFLNYQWHEPLIVFLLIFFIVGVSVGLLVATGSLFKQRRELQHLRREFNQLEKSMELASQPKPLRDVSTAAHIDVV